MPTETTNIEQQSDLPIAELLKCAEAKIRNLEEIAVIEGQCCDQLEAIGYDDDTSSVRLACLIKDLKTRESDAQAEIARLRAEADDVQRDIRGIYDRARAKDARLRSMSGSELGDSPLYQRGRDDLKRQLGMADVPDDKAVAHFGAVLDAAYQRGRMDTARECAEIAEAEKLRHDSRCKPECRCADGNHIAAHIRERYGLDATAREEKP